MDPKTVHLIVSLMASEVEGVPGSARFSLSFFVPNSPEGPQLYCFGTGSDATRHLNALTRFWTTMSFAVTLLDKNEGNWLPQDEISINMTRHTWPYEFEDDNDSRGGFLMSKTLTKNGLNKRNHRLYSFSCYLTPYREYDECIDCMSLIFCWCDFARRSRWYGKRGGWQRLVQFGRSGDFGGVLGAFGQGNYFLLAFCKLIYILAAAQHECVPRKMGPKRLWCLEKLRRRMWRRPSCVVGRLGADVQGTGET